MATEVFFSLPLLFLLSFSRFPSVPSVSFQISRFDTSTPDILYEGDTVASLGAVEFNKVQYISRVGQAIYAEGVLLWDSGSNKLSDFTTHFSFIIDTQGSSRYGNGFAFFLAPVGFKIPPNSGGGFFGLFNTTTNDSTRNQIVSVEFDSYANPEWDPPFEHVGINNNSVRSVKTFPWNASLHSGDTADAWIIYNATTKNLSVFWSYKNNPGFQENSSLSYQINLMEVLPEWVTVGFSAATGNLVEKHKLEFWKFSSSLDSEGLDKGNAKKIKFIIGLTVPLGILIVGGLVAVVILQRYRQSWGIRRQEEKISRSISDDFERGAGPKRFYYRELASATNNFSKEGKLGEGGFGAVYKGYLVDKDLPVAVKKISRGSRQGKAEYVTEVKIISQLRHRYLEQLIGWCHEGDELLLVYEYMPNGSLDFHLFGRRTPLTWSMRYKIALGLASALLYLHEEWEQCVVHRDIKSSNIMLDSNFNAKLGDFGLARLMEHGISLLTTELAGTRGYLSPEYVYTGRASKESDIYSFGVVALEIATGRKSVNPLNEESEMGLVEGVWDLYGRGKLALAADEKLHMDYDMKQVECLMVVGLWCVHTHHSFRPSIKQAIQVLNFEVAMPELPPKMPVPVCNGSLVTSTLSSGKASITYSSLETGR